MGDHKLWSSVNTKMNPKKMNELLDVILALIAAITIFAWLYVALAILT